MKNLFNAVLRVNDLAARAASNAGDWIFRKDMLIQSGKTEYEVIYENLPMRVRYYAPEDTDAVAALDGDEVERPARQHAVPLILVPPLGVTTETFDLMPDRSVARHMVEAGFRVYLIDWGTPERQHAHMGLHDYCYTLMGEAIQQIRQHSGSKDVSLFGWCMGGLMCLLHAGMVADPHIKNLVTVASPIDLRDGKNVMSVAANALNVTARFVRKYSEFRLERINPSLLGLPGWLVSLGFKLTAPVASITTYWDLITGLADREFVEQHATTADYLNNMRLYPGGVIRDFMVRFAVDNHMARGRVKIGDKVADLANISSSFLVFAGETDHLVPASMAKRSLDLVASQDKLFLRAPGGHMGVILGSKARANVWQVTVDWLKPRSTTLNQIKPTSKKKTSAST